MLKMKNSRLKEFLKEAGSTYVIVGIVLLVIGLFFIFTTNGNIIVDLITVIFGICLVLSVTIAIEYHAWKRRQ